MHFTLRQLDAFLVVAETASFTRAAEHLHLTPSAVSQLVIDLESLLGYKLFERSTRRVALSPAGRVFIASAEAVRRQVALARAVAADIRDQAAGVVRIAAPMVIASVLLPKLLAKYREMRPKVTVRMIDASVESLVDKVTSREADLAVGPDRPTSPEVERVKLFESPWVASCAPSHPLSCTRTLKWSDLQRHELVAAGPVHEIYRASRMPDLPELQRVSPAQMVDNISTALGLAAAGLCYTISPAYVEALAVPLGLMRRDIEGPVVLRDVSLLRRTEAALSPAAAGFASFLENSLKVEETQGS